MGGSVGNANGRTYMLITQYWTRAWEKRKIQDRSHPFQSGKGNKQIGKLVEKAVKGRIFGFGQRKRQQEQEESWKVQMQVKRISSVATSQILNSSPSSRAVKRKNLHFFQVQFNLQCVEYRGENPEGKAEKRKQNIHNRTRK